MKKSFKIYSLVWLISIALFNVICFIVPSEATVISKSGGAFWTGYIFITLAFIGHLVCAYMAFKAENLQKLFYNLPIIAISYTGLILSIIFGALCMAIPNFPNWISIIGCILILAFNAIAVIKATASAELVTNIDNEIKINTAFIKELTVKAQDLVGRANAPMIKDKCKKVYEAIRYSDPISNSSLFDIEDRIKEEFNVLTDAVISDDLDSTESSVKVLLYLIGERNNNAKMLK